MSLAKYAEDNYEMWYERNSDYDLYELQKKMDYANFYEGNMNIETLFMQSNLVVI